MKTRASGLSSNGVSAVDYEYPPAVGVLVKVMRALTFSRFESFPF